MVVIVSGLHCIRKLALTLELDEPVLLRELANELLLLSEVRKVSEFEMLTKSRLEW